MLRITGTFIDEITHDIPSQNWGHEEWACEFKTMRETGIDTVILIRAGYGPYATFNSKVLREKAGCFPVYDDQVDLFLTQAERCGMTFFFGTYDSGVYWHRGQYQEEVDINRAFCDEVIHRYGDRDAFGGWYISHEISTYDEGMMQVYQILADHLRALKSVPILVSPYIKGVKQFGDDAITLEQHEQEWATVFARLEGTVDIVAFQDGNVPLEKLSDYLAINRQLATRYGIRSWSNVESFDRDMPIKFPATDFRKLRYKIEQADDAGMEKLITFEFSHFMSPNASYRSARHMYNRYTEWLDTYERG